MMGDQLPVKARLVRGGHDVGHSGVTTGRGAFHFRSSSSVGDEENPYGWSFTLSRFNGQ
ncbi:hypothetical protein [Rummeliibacillus sp. SL167]|uniref:hypothetical protein n=1 Tax=Rummeliibacillus sp. SL167 TaxID=2579792 RepID=UPI001C95E294|nr:hypothetical protein [Rummeliibacillus sp. SL167]